MKKFGKDMGLLAAALLVCFLVLEFALRHFAFDPNHSYIRPPGWAYQVNSNGLLPHIEGGHLFLANRLGIRGDLPGLGAAPRVAVLGGSTVEEWVLSDEETWAQQMAARLRDCAPDIWVANLGKAGVNVRHHILQMKEVLDYMPRFDIFVVLSGLNDFLYDYRIHHVQETDPDWWRQQALAYGAGDEGTLASVALVKRIWNGLGKGKGPLISDFGTYQETLRSAYREVGADQWVDRIDVSETVLDVYTASLRELEGLARDRGARIVFATQPFLWSSTMSQQAKDQIYAGFIGNTNQGPDVKWYTPRALETGLSAYNDAMRKFCAEADRTCVDLARMIRREAGYFYDDFHFSERGAAEVGRRVGNVVRPLIPECRP
ncbi:MAG: GDSL-type esterase/lipase family protein [Pseudomonadota bacterium]